MKYHRILTFLGAVLLSVGVFLYPETQDLYGKVAWICFALTMIIRPWCELFHGTKYEGFWRQVMRGRQILGILSAVLGLAHGAGAMFLYGKDLTEVFDLVLWDFRSFWGWGLLGAAIMIPLLVTSNVWSMRCLKKWWKPLQRLAYIAFIVTGIHIFLATHEPGALVVLMVWAILWGVAHFKT